MKQKITIGFLTSEITRNNNSRLFFALKNQAIKANLNFIAYEGRSLKSANYAEKQNNFTYQLVNQSRVDHIIVPSAAMPESVSNKAFDQFFQSKTKHPVITYYNKRAHHHAIRINNSYGETKLLEHLINDHGFRKFIVVRGPIRDLDANQRFASSIHMLENARIKPLEFQSSWAAIDGIKIIKQIIKNHLDYQVIVFPNDETAIAALDYINNFKPELKHHFAIVGFDNSVNSKNISPQLTTVDHPHEAMAQKAIELITTKQPVITDNIFNTHEIIRASCGCSTKNEETAPTLKLFTDTFNMHENIQALSYDEYFNKLCIALAEKDMLGCSICLYNHPPFQLDSKSNVPPQSTLIFEFHDGQRQAEFEKAHFETGKLLPDNVIYRKPNHYLLVKNLFYSNHHFGYVVFDVSSGRLQDIADITANIATSLHIIYLFESMQKALTENARLVESLSEKNTHLINDNCSLKAISTTDEMTKLLNRRGFNQAIKPLIKNNEGQTVTFLYADMDRLKYVNDTFGHQAGDHAITVMANTLKTVFRKDDIIARIGGDEFVLCITTDDLAYIHTMIQRVDTELAKLNDNPFTISMSFGVHLAMLDEFFDLELAIKQADKNLYTQKQLKKQRLKQSNHTNSYK
ncbi:diguanylate cyclase domain-containing protein [Algibacillus agarilyticus]|uniref:diguanylate cyclase domain-containing protein n=1 Tax=Algibacillus agarilyticus TaxID=2234133 RepID=UPI000DD01EF1|nr:GGDEF domain-containing protein [Algibacillus agarilyticus]